MTKTECAIVTAHTGILMLQAKDIGYFYNYATKLMKRPVFTHEFADPDFEREIKRRSRDDFLKLCAQAEDR